MIPSWRRWCTQFGLATSLAMAGALVTNGNYTLAQVVPDATLGAERSVVRAVNASGVPLDVISGGATRGANLFHSFEQFSVLTGRAALFNNAAGIQNIISRVTGGSVSNIDGLLRANGTANVFLINPNGIIFGPNAQLRIGGSFVASTASSVNFADGTAFSAKAPAARPLLTVSVPIGLQYGPSAGSITNQSQATSSGTLVGLQVQPGKNLALVGGDVSLNGGQVTASGGRVELGGLNEAGTIGLSGDGSLSYPAGVQRADVSIINKAAVDVTAGGGGSIAVNARNVDIAGESSLFAGIKAGMGAVGSKAGDVTLNATDAITLRQSSSIRNRVTSNAIGHSGDINVTAGSLAITDGSFLITNSLGQGGGDITLNARSLSLDNSAELDTLTSGQGNAGNIAVNVTESLTASGGSALRAITTGAGNGGDINIQTRSLFLDDSAQLGTSTFGQGNAGNIRVNASDFVSVRGGSVLQASTYGQGNAGSITIAGRDGVVPVVSFDGVGADGSSSSAVTLVADESTGKGGEINITAKSLSLTNGAQVNTSPGPNIGQDAGNIRVNVTESLTGSRGSPLFSNTTGAGNAGNVNIQAGGTVSFSGVNSGVVSGQGSSGVGNGGNINIQTRSLFLDDSAQLATSTFGQGNAGNIQVNASDSVSIRDGSVLQSNDLARGNAGSITIAGRDGLVPVVAFDGVGANGLSSRASSAVDTDSTAGKGGEINITASSLSLTNGAQVNTSTGGRNIGQDAGNIAVNVTESLIGSGGVSELQSNTYGPGNAGNVTVKAGGTVAFNKASSEGPPSGISTLVTSVPGFIGDRQGGDINITARSLSLANGAQLQTYTSGQGNAGNVSINARDAVTATGVNSGYNSGVVSAVESTGVGKGGNISIQARSLSLTDGGELNASTGGRGDAGSVTIQASDAISFDGVGSNGYRSGVFSAVNSGAVGKGGNVKLTTGSLSLTNGADLSSSTVGQGDAGNISVGVDNAVSLTNSSYILGRVAAGGQGKGADIDINARSLSVTNGSQVGALLSRQQGNLPGGQGRGGQIQINAPDFVTLSGVDKSGNSSGLLALSERGASGRAGNITVSTGNFRVADGAIVAAGTFNPGGDGGDITINAKNFEALNGGQVLTNTRSSGNAGSITLNATDSITLSGSDPNLAARQAQVAQQLRSPGQTDQVSDVIINEGAFSGLFANTATGSSGAGGSIFIDPNRLTVTDGAGVVLDSRGSGSGGNLNVQAGTLNLDNHGFISATATSAEGGNILLNVPSLLLMRHNSRISATSGIAGGSGNGGNIDINSKFLAAFPSEDSDITANAFTGKGGNIQIAAQGIFGIQSQPRDTPFSDITASSTLGINGTVQINTLVIDPSRGLVVLPVNIVDASGLIAQSCPATGGQAASKFVVTGRGGLPPTPSDTLSTDAVLTNWATLEHDNEKRSATAHVTHPAKESEPTQIVEAQGWVIGSHGEVILTAQPTTVTPNSPGLNPPTCHGS